MNSITMSPYLIIISERVQNDIAEQLSGKCGSAGDLRHEIETFRHLLDVWSESLHRNPLALAAEIVAVCTSIPIYLASFMKALLVVGVDGCRR